VSSVLIIAEQRRGELRPVSLELIGAAQALRRSDEAVAVAIIASAPSQFIEPLKLAGVDEIVAVKVESAEFDPDTFEAVTAALIAERKPELVLVAHSVDSFGYVPAIAAKLGLGFASTSPAGARCCSRCAPMCSSRRSKPARRASPKLRRPLYPAARSAAASSSSRGAMTST
jgi:electron transfer flavoprotein alpha subunit